MRAAHALGRLVAGLGRAGMVFWLTYLPLSLLVQQLELGRHLLG